ncbi:MAG: alpha/beta fold hydrolase [Proteobacteria bacterium]|nr:alpha/beta fold hydrolase [Pseudomonadota bacterium]
MNLRTVSLLLVMGMLCSGTEASGAAESHGGSTGATTGATAAGDAIGGPALVGPTAGAPTADGSSLALTACKLEDPTKVSLVLAECGELRVPENPAEPGGRSISLHLARVPAVNRRKQQDPLFVIAGGPGMAATTFYASVAFAFERIHRDRDIVLVDQRGTGQSNPLNCTLDDDALYHTTDAEIAADAKRCLTTLEKTSRVEFYTTSVAVRDLDAVRVALGYQRINLYGVSYGTRVAQHYVRRFPDKARSVILDGVVPPQAALGTETAINAENALSNILARCANDSECSKHFGDPATAYHSLRTALQAHSVSVSLPDPSSGEPSKLEFTHYHLATVLRLGSYTSEQAALLPLMLHGATAASANFIPLASQFLMVNRSYGDAVAYGMHNSIVCSEDVPFWDLSKVNRNELKDTFLGTAQLDGLKSICSIWPRGPIDPDFHTELHSEVPALLLSGGNDPVTPATGAEQAKHGFTHSVHVVINGLGHGQLTAPCVDRVMASFISKGAVDGLDVSCVKNDVPLPFFLTVGGPAP